MSIRGKIYKITIIIIVTLVTALVVKKVYNDFSHNRKLQAVRTDLDVPRSSNNPNEIIFQSAGVSFSAILSIIGAPEITWVFADGSISHDPSVAKQYESAKLRSNRLTVTPWNALSGIDIGYDRGDGGPTSIRMLPPQNITAVYGLNNVAQYLTSWSSSNNPIPILDFSNFVNLREVECYDCSSLTTVILKNTPHLSRACFEANALTYLDISESPELSDLRGALNRFQNIVFGTTGKKLWHLCVHDNNFSQNLPPMSQFPSLKELWIWNDHQTGALHPVSTLLTSVIAYGNEYTSADFTGCFAQGANGELDIHENLLKTLIIANCPALMKLNASSNNLKESAIDSVLQTIESFGTRNGLIDLTSNTPPSDLGRNYISNLEDRGWTVEVDSTSLFNRSFHWISRKTRYILRIFRHA
ncbi:MAG: hypothetical protein M0036_08290 [Desulfobacteraceae bacterium]|nr:hypothetical protein [Desulfobacteraceae bacterium]